MLVLLLVVIVDESWDRDGVQNKLLYLRNLDNLPFVLCSQHETTSASVHEERGHECNFLRKVSLLLLLLLSRLNRVESLAAWGLASLAAVRVRAIAVLALILVAAHAILEVTFAIPLRATVALRTSVGALWTVTWFHAMHSLFLHLLRHLRAPALVTSSLRRIRLCHSNRHLWAALNHGCVASPMVSNVVVHWALKRTHLVLAIALRVLHVRRLVFIFVAIASLALAEVVHFAAFCLLVLLALLLRWA